LRKIGNINEINRNDVNDAKITITVDFDTRFDYKNKARNFIQKLMTGTYGV